MDVKTKPKAKAKSSKTSKTPRTPPRTTLPPLLPVMRQQTMPMGALGVGADNDLLPVPESSTQNLVTSPEDLFGLLQMLSASEPPSGEEAFLQSDINNLQNQAQPVSVNFPEYNRSLPPPILPPSYDREGEQAQARRALQASAFLPLIGQLLGGGDIGSEILPQALASSLTGIRNRETEEYGRATDLYGMQRQNRADRVQAIDFSNDLLRQDFTDRYAVDRENQNRITEALREKRLLQRESTREAETRRRQSADEEKARQTAITNIRNTAKEFPNDPQLIHALHGDSIQKHNLAIGRDEQGRVTIDGTPIDSLSPTTLIRSREQAAANLTRDEKKHGLNVAMEKLRQDGRLDVEDYRYINKLGLEEAQQNGRITLRQMQIASTEKIAEDRNDIARDRNRIAEMSASARQELREKGGLDQKTAITRLEQVQSKITALKTKRAEAEKWKAPARIKEFGRTKYVEQRKETIDAADALIQSIDEELARYNSLRDIYLDGANLKVIPDKQGRPRYLPKTGKGNAGSSSINNTPSQDQILKPLTGNRKSHTFDTVPKDPNFSARGLTPQARNGVSNVVLSLSPAYNIKLNSGYRESSPTANGSTSNTPHRKGTSVDLGLYGDDRNDKTFRKLLSDVMRIPGVRWAQYEPAGTVNRNGSVATGPHIHVEFSDNAQKGKIASAGNKPNKSARPTPNLTPRQRELARKIRERLSKYDG